MQKILEIKNNDWMKGISAQPNVALGGLFQYFNGCDPFEQGGLALPSTVPDNQTLGTTPKVLTQWNDGSFPAVNHLYAHTDSKLYDVLTTSPYTVVDKTSQINQGSMDGSLTGIGGAIIYNKEYVYASLDSDNNAYINRNAFPVASGTDHLIKKITNVDLDHIPFCIGPDGNLYWGGDGFVGNATIVGGTTTYGNNFAIDPGFSVRDITHDGQYLIIVADNNAVYKANRAVGKYKVQIYFWDMVSTENGGANLSQSKKWEFEDSYVIAVKFLENAVYVFTYNGIYICNIGTSPKFLRPWSSNLEISGRPYDSHCVTQNKGSLYWVNSENDIYNYIYAYGNPVTGQPKIFYQPYQQIVGDFNNTCLSNAGNELIMGCDQPGLFFFNVGTTRGGVTVKTLDTNMESPVTYGFTKVVLGQKLASGQSVQLIVYGNGGNDQISAETKSYNSANPKQELVFKRIPTSTNQPEKFEDITVTINSVGAALQRVSVYGTPTDDSNETL